MRGRIKLILFLSSTFILFESLYEMEVFLLLKRRFATPDCDGDFTDYMKLIIFYYYFYTGENCGKVSILDFAKEEIWEGTDDRMKEFLYALDEAGYPDKKLTASLKYFTIVWFTLYIFLALLALPIFCISFGPVILGKKVIYYALSPFLAVLTGTIIVDLSACVYYSIILIRGRVPMEWAITMGVNRTLKLATVSKQLSNAHVVNLNFFTQWLVFLSSRHALGLPLFIFIDIILLIHAIRMSRATYEVQVEIDKEVKTNIEGPSGTGAGIATTTNPSTVDSTTVLI